MRTLLLTSLFLLTITSVGWAERSEPQKSQTRSPAPAVAVQQAMNTSPAEAQSPWWGNAAAGWIGAIGGSLVGLFGALIGTLAGLGKARRFVLALTVASIVFGLAALVLGLVALGLRQPYVVYYPLALIGVILTFVMGSLLPVLRRRYQQIELRRMAAMDAGDR